MNIDILISQSIKSLQKLPDDKVYEVIDFIEFLSKKDIEEKALQKGIEKMVSQSKSFSFLNEEEDIYNETDVIEKY